MIREQIMGVPQWAWDQLRAQQCAVVNALANRERRDYWLREARGTELRDIRSLQISFARSAQKAYMNDLKRAVRMARERIG